MTSAGHRHNPRETLCLHVVATIDAARVVQRDVAFRLALLADTTHRAPLVGARWYDPALDQSVEIKSRSLPREERNSPERVMAIARRAVSGVTAISIAGREPEKPEHPPWANRLIVSVVGDADMLQGRLAFSATFSIRFDYTIVESSSAWRGLAKRAIEILADAGGHGSGVVEIGLGRKWNYGTSLIGLTSPQTFDQSVVWNRWCLSVKAGEDTVPWTPPGVIVSPAAGRAVGGLTALESELQKAFDHSAAEGDEPLVEPVSGEGAIVWLAPKFHYCLPGKDGDDQVSLSIEGHRGARMYMVLQRLGLAL